MPWSNPDLQSPPYILLLYTCVFIFTYFSRDDDSGLMRVELGAGLTTSDISVLAWVPIINNYTATVTYKIDVADGQRAFIRIRATNNGMYIYKMDVMLIN